MAQSPTAPFPVAPILMRERSHPTHRRGLAVACLLAATACETAEPAPTPRRSAVEHLETSARAAVQRNDVDAALELYDQAVLEARFPTADAGARTTDGAAYSIGRCRIEQARLCVVTGRFQRARSCADEALAPECLTSLTHEQRSTVLALRAFANLRVGNAEEAARDYAAAKQAAPGTPWVLAYQDAATGRGELLQKAREAIAAQRWEEALARLDEVVAVREDAEALTWRGAMYDRLGRGAEAVADRRRARELRQSAVQVVPAVATAMPSAPAPTMAPLPPDRRSAELLAALLAEAVGADEAAAERFATRREAFAARSGFGELAGLEDALEHLFAGRWEAAERELSGVVVAQPQRAAAFYARAIGRLQQGRLADGAADASQVTALAPGQAAGWRLRAAARAGLQQYGEAIDDLGRAVVAAPKEAGAWAARGHLRDLVGDAAGAVADYRRALELGGAGNWVPAALARRLLEGGKGRDPAAALALAKEVVGRSPRDPEALGLLARALAATGDFPAATAAVDAALQCCADPGLRAELAADREAFAAGRIRPFRAWAEAGKAHSGR